MRSRAYRRWQRVMWAGVALSALFVALLAASFRWTVEYGWGSSWWTLEEARFRVGWFYSGDPRVKTKTQGWSLQPTAPDPRWEQQLPSWRFSGPPFAYINLPLWPLLIVLGAATRFAWVRSRRFGGRSCCTKCGHSRDGLSAETVCPECGQPTIT